MLCVLSLVNYGAQVADNMYDINSFDVLDIENIMLHTNWSVYVYVPHVVYVLIAMHLIAMTPIDAIVN